MKFSIVSSLTAIGLSVVATVGFAASASPDPAFSFTCPAAQVVYDDISSGNPDNLKIYQQKSEGSSKNYWQLATVQSNPSTSLKFSFISLTWPGRTPSPTIVCNYIAGTEQSNLNNVVAKATWVEDPSFDDGYPYNTYNYRLTGIPVAGNTSGFATCTTGEANCVIDLYATTNSASHKNLSTTGSSK